MTGSWSRLRRYGLVALVLAVGLWALPSRPAVAAAATAEPVVDPALALCHGLRLIDRAAEAGIAFRHDTGARGGKHLPETMGAGLAWVDYDGDGWLDLYLVQSGPFPPPSQGVPAAADRLWRNRGDGSFEEVVGIGDRGYGQGAVAADADGDGDVDLYITNYGADRWWINRGDGVFEPGADGLDGWSSSAALADADGDGDLDLYVTRYVLFDPAADLFCGDLDAGERTYCDPSLFEGAADRYFENRGAGRFVDATARAGLAGASGRGLGVLFTDLDGDGAPELYVANDLTLNFLFANLGFGKGGPGDDGGARFEDQSLFSGAAVNGEGKPEAGMGLAAGDIDGDGDPDLGVTNFDVETNTLYRNLGGLQFEDASLPAGFGLPSFNLLGFGLVLVDFDLDGDLDFYAADGHIFESPRRADTSYAQTDLLLLGDGAGHFVPARCGPAFETALVGRGLAAADYDNDGDPDLAISNSAGPAQLLANERAPEAALRRWVGVRLVGRAPNTEAVGARVRLRSSGGEQVRWVLAGDSYQSSSERRVQFGLGESAPAGSEAPLEVEVRWPSGRVVRVVGVREGAYSTVVE